MSWNGTVRCRNCHEEGHNKTGCPELRKAWEQDPTSHKGRQWAQIQARKARPKVCGYCDETGHTRAGCLDSKRHKAQFQADLNLWRKALAKWMEDVGLGIGALVKCTDAAYYRGEDYMYPSDDTYIPPVGLVMNNYHADLTHYAGIMNTAEWMSSNSLVSFEYLGAPSNEAAYRKNIGCALPCIPGIVPRYGKPYYGGENLDRNDQNNNVKWEVVSVGQTDFRNDVFLSAKDLKRATKRHFAADNDQAVHEFRTFGDFQRNQLQQYVNGEIELSEMKDPDVPSNDT